MHFNLSLFTIPFNAISTQKIAFKLNLKISGSTKKLFVWGWRGGTIANPVEFAFGIFVAECASASKQCKIRRPSLLISLRLHSINPSDFWPAFLVLTKCDFNLKLMIEIACEFKVSKYTSKDCTTPLPSHPTLNETCKHPRFYYRLLMRRERSVPKVLSQELFAHFCTWYSRFGGPNPADLPLRLHNANTPLNGINVPFNICQSFYPSTFNNRPSRATNDQQPNQLVISPPTIIAQKSIVHSANSPDLGWSAAPYQQVEQASDFMDQRLISTTGRFVRWKR